MSDLKLHLFPVQLWDLTVLTKFQKQHGHLECHVFLWPLDCTVKCLTSHYIHSVALAVGDQPQAMKLWPSCTLKLLVNRA